jgi:hypothetical protein
LAQSESQSAPDRNTNASVPVSSIAWELCPDRSSPARWEPVQLNRVQVTVRQPFMQHQVHPRSTMLFVYSWQ